MKTMKYKGYTAEVYYSDEDGFFVGDVVDIGDDIVCFHGDTDEELQEAFEGVLDHYLEFKERPETLPQRHFVERFLARLRQAFNL